MDAIARRGFPQTGGGNSWITLIIYIYSNISQAFLEFHSEVIVL